MKKVANAPIMPATTTSIAMMPMLVAIVSGELASPKQTGQASAARGAATAPSVNSVFAYRCFAPLELRLTAVLVLRWNAAP